MVNERRAVFLTVTDTEVTTIDAHLLDPVAHVALCEWLQVHDIDPAQVPASTTITRDEAGCRVVYERIMRDTEGRLMDGGDGFPAVVGACSQGEAPPLPWPDVVRRLGELESGSAGGAS